MKKLIVYLIMFTFFVTSCASSSRVINFESDGRVKVRLKKLNLVSKNKPCEIFLENKEKYFGKNTFVRMDSTFWEDSTRTKISIPSNKIEKVIINVGKNTGASAVKGMLLGIGLGFLMGYADASKNKNTEDLATPVGVGFGFYGAIVGLAFGILTGVGKKDTFITYTFING